MVPWSLLLLLSCSWVPMLSAQTIGPQWRQLPGPTGGDVRHLSRASDGTLWAATSSGLYTHTGNSWRKLAHTPFGQATVYRVWPLRNTTKLLVLAQRAVYWGSETAGWQRVLQGADGLESDGHQHWAWARNGQIWRSTGEPTAWDSVGAPTRLASLALDSGGQVWLAAADTLRLWTGLSSGWAEVGAAHLPPGPFESIVAWAFTADSLYAGTSTGRLLVRARDNPTWDLRGADDPLIGGLTALLMVGKRLYAASDRGLLRYSDDGGRTWRAVLSIPSADSLYCLLADAGGRVLVGSYRNGILVYEAGQAPSHLNAGLTATNAEHLAWVGDSSLVAAIRDVGVFCSRDGGQTWVKASAGLGFTQQLDLLSANGRLWVGGLGAGRIYESRDTANTWRAIGTNLPDFGATALLWRPAERRLLAGTPRQGVYAWNGFDWRPLPRLGLPDASIRRLALDPQGQVVAAVSGHGIFRYLDDLERWEALTDGLPAGLVQGLWSLGDSLYAAAAERLLVWRTNRWAEVRRFVDAANQPVLISGLAIDSAGELIVSTQGLGCWRSQTDSTARRHWQAFNEGLFNPVVIDLQASPGGQFLASTAGDGLFTWQPWSPTDSVVGRKPTPVHDAWRIYPNPASDWVHLTYHLHRAPTQPIVLEVFDGTGRRVLQQLLDGRSGTETLATHDWNSGFYILQLGNLRQKILLIK